MMLDNEKLNTQLEDRDYLLLQEAYEKYNAGLIDEAERIFSRLSLRYPDNPEIINDHGVCLWGVGKLTEAVQKFIEALKLSPDYKEARLNLSKVREVINIYSQKLYPDNSDIHEQLTPNNLDTPDISEPIKGVVCFEGWAVSKYGIERVDVFIDDNFICCADYGLPRPDAASNYPNMDGCYNSGYRFYLNTLKFKNSTYRVCIKIYAKNGDVTENTYSVKIDNIELSSAEINILRQKGNFEEDEMVLDSSIFLPSYISLETTVICPARCIMCPRDAVLKRRKNTFLPERLVEKILDEVDWECKINWEWINEPLCDDRIYGFMKKAKKRSFENWITTTGFLLDEDKIYKLLDSDVDVIVFSIDTLNPDLYKKIRGLNLDIVLKNLRNFISIKEKAQSKTEVWISKIQLPITIFEDREEYIKFFKTLGIEKIQFPVYRVRGGELDKEIIQEVPNRKQCYFIENEMAITVDGDVVLCPCEAGAWVEQEANISNMSIKDAWLTRKRIKTIMLIRTSGLKAFRECREHTGLSE